MRIVSSDQIEFHIYASGPIEVAKQILREKFLERGFCVTISPTLYIYHGGEESGYEVGIRNYPRFPESKDSLRERALDLARTLLDGTHQSSIMVTGEGETVWFSKRE